MPYDRIRRWATANDWSFPIECVAVVMQCLTMSGAASAWSFVVRVLCSVRMQFGKATSLPRAFDRDLPRFPTQQLRPPAIPASRLFFVSPYSQPVLDGPYADVEDFCRPARKSFHGLERRRDSVAHRRRRHAGEDEDEDQRIAEACENLTPERPPEGGTGSFKLYSRSAPLRARLWKTTHASRAITSSSTFQRANAVSPKDVMAQHGAMHVSTAPTTLTGPFAMIDATRSSVKRIDSGASPGSQ
jgi:hypothetical protein